MEKINRVVSDSNAFIKDHLLNLKSLVFGLLDNKISVINYLLKRSGAGDLVFMEIGYEVETKVFIISLVIQDTFNENEDGHALVLEYYFAGEETTKDWTGAEHVSLALEGLLGGMGIMTQDMSHDDNEVTLDRINHEGVTVLIEGYDY